MKKKIEIAVLLIYTIINLKILVPFIFNASDLRRMAFSDNISFLAIFITLFLNTFLIIYWFNKK